MAKRPRNASGAGATFEIRPLAHMLIQPDFGCFFSRDIYHPKRDTAHCVVVHKPHTPPFPDSGRPGACLFNMISVVFSQTQRHIPPPRDTAHCVVVHQPHTPPFPDSGRPGACLFNLISVVFSQTQRHIPPPRDTAHCVLSYTSHTPLHFPIRAAPGPGVQRNSGSVNFG